jgi:predicted ATP-dependent serine protease
MRSTQVSAMTFNMASAKSSALYITGEESLSQVALRAQRLDLPTDQLKVMAEVKPHPEQIGGFLYKVFESNLE